MSKLTPIIKLNGGNPIALCNRCFSIICYVYTDDYETAKPEDYKVLKQYREDISTPIGGKVPIHCDKCKELLKYSLNE